MLTLGPPEAEEQLRYAVSRRHDQGRPARADRRADWDPQRTARAITAAVRRLEAADGPFDLILFGNESADSGGFQVGIRVAHALGRPMVNGGKGIEVDRRRRAHVRARSGRRAGDVRAAAAGGRRRQGGHQPAPLPDDEGAAGVEEGRRAHAEVDALGGGQRSVRLQAGRAGLGDDDPRHGAEAAPRWSTCSPSSGCCDGRTVLVVVEHDRGELAPAGARRRSPPHARSATVPSRR